MTIHEYIERKHILENSPSILRNGEMFVVHKGKEIPIAKFRKMFALPDRLNFSKENPDKTKLWINE